MRVIADKPLRMALITSLIISRPGGRDMPRLADGPFHQVNFSLPIRHFTMIRHADLHPARSGRAMMDLLNHPTEEDRVV